MTRHFNEVIQNRDVHLQEILNQSKVLGESTIGVDGTEEFPMYSRKVSLDIIKHSELLSPAMREKLGSLRSGGNDKHKNTEKKRWSTVMEGIPEEEKENAVELTPMNLYSPMVDKEPKWQ